VAGEIGKWALGTAFGKGVGEAFGAVAGAVAKALPEIAKLFGVGNDHLGQRVHTWNVQELATGVPPGQSKTFKDEFLNDDDTGSYDVTFTILCQP